MPFGNSKNDKEDRFKYSKLLIANAEPLPFSIEILRWFRDEKDEVNQNGFSSDEKMLLRKLLANRVKELSVNTNILDEFPADSGSILGVWSAWGTEGDESAYLEKVIKENPAQITLLLDSVVPTAWEMGSGKSSKSDLERDVHDYICKIIDPAKVIDTLDQLYGDELFTKEYPYDFPGENVNLRLAQQFAWIHKKVHLETKNKEDSSTEQPKN